MEMLKLGAAIAAILIAISTAMASERPLDPKVTLFLTQSAGQSSLAVEMEFEGHSSGETTLFLPNAWGGQTQLYRAIRDLEVENATLHDSAKGPAERTLKHASNAIIKLKYRLADDALGPPDKGGGNDYRIKLKPDLIFALGNAWSIKPSSVRLDWPVQLAVAATPNTLAVASDLQHQSAAHRLSFGAMIESVLIAGEIRVIDAGGGARLAIYGKIDGRDDQGWKDAFTTIAAAQRRYWNSGEEPYLVTILSSPPPSGGHTMVGGTGRSDAFAFFATTNARTEALDRGMAHEMMHTWIPRRIGKMPDGGDEPLAYWISEGFTDWAFMRVMARSRYWKPEQFAALLNEMLFQYDLFPVRAEPNARIAKDFWNDRNVGDLPYRRGMLLAFYWDGQIRKAAHNARDFDDVFLQMQTIAKANPETPIREALRRAMKEVAGFNIGKALEKHVDHGAPVELPEDLFAPCGTVLWIDRAKFHRGFDIEATQKNGNVITGVVKDGPAYRAGLRDGMKLVKRSGGEVGNSQVEIAYDVIDSGAPKTLRWMPEGPGRERFRRFVLAQDLKGERETACAQRLGGL